MARYTGPAIKQSRREGLPPNLESAPHPDRLSPVLADEPFYLDPESSREDRVVPYFRVHVERLVVPLEEDAVGGFAASFIIINCCICILYWFSRSS